MNYLYAIILGIVQGITEFLPISSSGHLLVLHDLLSIDFADNLAFDVFLHWGTLVALVVYFFNDIILYLKAFLNSFSHFKAGLKQDEKIAWFILLSMIPALGAGVLLEQYIEILFRNTMSVAIFLIAMALVFFVAEKVAKNNLAISGLTWDKALCLGLAQALALIPGVSRSGSTIVTGLFLGLKRDEAARFTFLMSVPIVFAAGCKKLWDLTGEGFVFAELGFYLLGFVAAAVSGYLVVKFLLDYLKNHSLNIFAYYRIIISVIILLILFS